MTRVYKHCDLEEHELELFCREFECPNCNASGVEELTGNDCADCFGWGYLYLKDCRPCCHCGVKIYFEKIGEKYLPYEVNTEQPHRCLKDAKVTFS